MTKTKFEETWLAELEEIGKRIAKFRDDVRNAKDKPKTNEVPDFIEKIIRESSEYIPLNTKIRKSNRAPRNIN